MHVFVTCKNYFYFLLDFTGFKNFDFLQLQSLHNDVCAAVLFTKGTPLIFYVFFLQTKQ